MAKKKPKKKVETNEKLKGISSNKIWIKVFKDFGSNTAILKAEYDATERRDTYNNLIAINKEFLHDEDIDFSMDDVYNEMQVLLEFKNKKKVDKIEVLDKKIKYQEELIKILEKFPEFNSIYNYSDENLKLKDYRLLTEYTQNIEGAGAYFTIEKGKRVYSYDSVDGFLIPVWRGIAKHSQYPDHTRKKKIVIQEDIILKQELQKYNINKKLGNMLVWGMIINSILMAIFVFGIFKTTAIYTDYDAKAHESASLCVEYTSSINYNGDIKFLKLNSKEATAFLPALK